MKNKTGIILFLLVSVAYGVLFSLNESKALLAIKESLHVLLFIIPILVIVFFLMALLNTFVDEKSISKHIGEGSSLKGWSIALISGILSHGPGYVWFPLLQDLRAKGVNDGLIITFLYARAIKIPWIPMMISYFGLSFTVIFSIYILVGALLQGLLANQLDRLLGADPVEDKKGDVLKLSDLRPKQKAIIKSIGDLGELKARLMDLGVLCGEPVQIVRIAPLGDPVEIRVGNEHLALRGEDAEKIEVEAISQLRARKRKGLF